MRERCLILLVIWLVGLLWAGMGAPAVAKTEKPAATETTASSTPDPEAVRQARQDYQEATEHFNARRYRQAAELFARYLKVFPNDGQAQRLYRIARRLAQRAGTGTLVVECEPPAEVWLDGKPVGTTPLTLEAVPVGTHQVEVRRGRARQSAPVEVEEYARTNIRFRLSAPAEAATPPSPPAPAPPAAAPAIPPSPAPPPRAARPAPPAPPTPPPPAPARVHRGYVVAVEGQEVTIDLGAKDGIKPGQRLRVLARKKLVHPVSGKTMFLRRPVGVIQVTEVEDQLSLARVVSFQRTLAPGQEVVPLAPGEAAAPPAPAPTPTTPAPAKKELRLAVMPPLINAPGGNPDFNPQTFRAAQVAHLLNQLRRIRAVAVPPARLEALRQELGEWPAAWREDGQLDPAQQEALDKLLEKLGVDAALWWSVTLREYEEQLTLGCVLRRQGRLRPLVADEALVNVSEAPQTYGRELFILVAEGLGIF